MRDFRIYFNKASNALETSANMSSTLPSALIYMKHWRRFHYCVYSLSAFVYIELLEKFVAFLTVDLFYSLHLIYSACHIYPMRFPEELLIIHKRIPLRNTAWTQLLRLIGQQIRRLKIKSWYWSRKNTSFANNNKKKKKKKERFIKKNKRISRRIKRSRNYSINPSMKLVEVTHIVSFVFHNDPILSNFINIDIG